MRELKFRVFDGEQMVSPDFIDRSGAAYWKENSIPISSKEIMQYTGLKDKNGVEIYEGDILDFDIGEWGGKFYPEVVVWEDIIGEWQLCGSYSDVSEWRQVIGNIHENPELLK